MVDRIKVSTVQLRGDDCTDLESYRDYLYDLIKRAGKPDIIVLPEYALLPLLQNHSGVKRSEIRALYDKEFAEKTDQMLEIFESAVKKFNTHILVGSHWTFESNMPCNSAFFFWPTGQYESFPKHNPTPPEEAMSMNRGTKNGLVELSNGVIAGIVICLDVEFPEISRDLVAKGADLLLVPSLTVNDRGAARVEICSRARAIENQVYVISSTNQSLLSIPEEKPLKPIGRAGIFGPADNKTRLKDGIIKRSEQDGEDLLTADLDLSILEASRYKSEAPLRSLNERKL